MDMRQQQLDREQRVMDKVGELCNKVSDMYPDIDFEGLALSFSEGMGKGAGMFEGRRTPGGERFARNAELRFNTVAMDLNIDHVLEDIVAHELAHLVVWLRGGKNGHHRQWQKLAQKLGASGDLYHPLDLPSREREWLYIGDQGTEVRFTTRTHNRIQNGQVRRVAKTGERFSAVGFIGEAIGDLGRRTCP